MSLAAKLKLCILCLILLLVAAALFIALLPFLVSTDAIRLRLARDLSSITGYNVQLREPPHIGIFPSFQASLRDVVLSDNSETNAPLMEVEKIIVHMSPWDALRGRARFSETQLIRPHFTVSESLKTSSIFAALARSQGSLGNALREIQDKLETEKSNGHTDKSFSNPLFLQPFGRIIIKDGLLTYTTPAPLTNAATPPNTSSLRDEIRAIQAEIVWPQHSHAAFLSASGIWHGVLTRLEINADDALLLLSGGKSDLRVSFNSAKGGITFTGAAQAGQNWAAQGQLAARSPGFNQTLNWLKIRPPFGIAFIAPFIWESELKANASSAELSNIILTIGDDNSGDRGRGALDIGYGNGLPHLNGSLAFEKLNIDLPAPLLFQTETLPSPKKHFIKNSFKPIVDMPIFNLFGLDMRISVDKARFNGIAANDVAASIQIQKSSLIFDVGTMRIFDGTAQSTLRMKSNDERITDLEARFSASDINIEKLQQSFTSFGFSWPQRLNLRARANIGLNMQATLPEKPAVPPLPASKPQIKTETEYKQSQKTEEHLDKIKQSEKETPVLSYYMIFVHDIWPYANGQLNFTLNKGSLAQFDMSDFLRRLKLGNPFPLQQPANPSTHFDFNQIEGKFTIDRGFLNPLTLIVLFDNHRLELQGRADITGNKLNLNGALDPIKLNSSRQCADITCLQQSLLPATQFSAEGAPFALPAIKDTMTAAKTNKAKIAPDHNNNIQIIPKIETLPY